MNPSSAPKKRTVSILGSYGEGNIGDEAILRGIMHEIRGTHPDTQFIVFTHDLAETHRLHPGVIGYPVLPAGIRSLGIQTLTGEMQRSMKVLQASDEIIIGGGGIFYDHAFSQGRNPTRVWKTRCNTIRRLGKSYRIHAVGVSAFTKHESKENMQFIAAHASTISVRDQISKAYLEALGITKPIEIERDPAFNLPVPSITKPSRKHPLIGISLRVWFHDAPGKQEQLIEKMVTTIDRLIRDLHAEIVLIPFSVGTDDDRKILEQVRAEIIAKQHSAPSRGTSSMHNVASAITLADTSFTIESHLALIGNLDLLLGMRLHSLIFAELTHTPWIALGYAEKVTSLATQVGKEASCLDLEHFAPEEALGLTKKVLVSHP